MPRWEEIQQRAGSGSRNCIKSNGFQFIFTTIFDFMQVLQCFSLPKAYFKRQDYSGFWGRTFILRGGVILARSGLMCFLSVSRYVDDFWKIQLFHSNILFENVDKSTLTHKQTYINQCFGGRGVSTNDSSYGFPPCGWSRTIFWMDK